MTLDYEEIGNNIRYFRKKKRLKQQQLAELVSSSPGHISHIECGRGKMSMELLIQIANALSISLYALLGNNVQQPTADVVSMEFSTLLHDATQTEKNLCLEVCRTILDCNRRAK